MPNTIYNHYTYLLEYSDGMLYHGVRSCKCPIEEDNYYGSSKYTPDEIPKKKILTIHKTREEANLEEVRYHKEFDVKCNKLYYNRANSTSTGFTTLGTKQPKILKIKRRLNKTTNVKSIISRFKYETWVKNSRRCICIECKKPVYINQLNEHIC